MAPHLLSVTSGFLQRILDIFWGKDFNGNWISFHLSKHLKMQGRSEITYSSNDNFSWLLSIMEHVGFGFVAWWQQFAVASIPCMLEKFWKMFGACWNPFGSKCSYIWTYFKATASAQTLPQLKLGVRKPLIWLFFV